MTLQELLFADGMVLIVKLQQNLEIYVKGTRKIKMDINNVEIETKILSTKARKHRIIRQERARKLTWRSNRKLGELGNYNNYLRTAFLGRKKIPKVIKER